MSAEIPDDLIQAQHLGGNDRLGPKGFNQLNQFPTTFGELEDSEKDILVSGLMIQLLLAY
jgi:hypothetical protein